MQELLWTLQNFPTSWQNLLDLALVAAIFFLVLRLVRGTGAATLLRGIAIVLILVWALSAALNLQAFNWLLSRMLGAVVVALPVIFQHELRRWFDQVGRLELLSIVGGDGQRAQAIIEEICDAAWLMGLRRHGALMVIERETGLQEYIETGVPVDAALSSRLLQTIFYPKTSLHDGAVIIRDGRIVAAGCTLPISARRRLPDVSMGMRHRASLGISETTDAVVIVVSEESGKISTVINGVFSRSLDVERLAALLRESLEPPEIKGMTAWLMRLRKLKPDQQRAREPHRSA